MSLRIEDVKRLAELTRLHLSDEELEKRRAELERVLEYVDRLAKIDTAGVPEGEGHEVLTAWRNDVAEASSKEAHDAIVTSFPDRMGDALKVPAVFESPKG